MFDQPIHQALEADDDLARIALFVDSRNALMAQLADADRRHDAESLDRVSTALSEIELEALTRTPANRAEAAAQVLLALWTYAFGDTHTLGEGVLSELGQRFVPAEDLSDLLDRSRELLGLEGAA